MKSIHIDFHTSPDIPDIGKDFNKEEFASTLKAAGVDSATVFAKCHHGYTYYPSRVGTMHPGLSFNLLKEEIDALHSIGAKAPIYITVGWSKKDADEHPEWHHVDFYTGKSAYAGEPFSDDPDAPIKDCSWVALCPSGPYLEHLKAITHEICREFHPVDGIFYDIVFFGEACVCEACKDGMTRRGLDPKNYEDAKKYYVDRRLEALSELSDIVHGYAPKATVFFNSGGADMNRPEFHGLSTHYELEDLPTAWGGYDEMPIRAKFFEKLGKDFIGMTGKFHHNWGEFGGFKSKEALKYEMADMLSVGVGMSIGDHLHPSGKIDRGTYRNIGYAYNYVDSIKTWCDGAKLTSDIALYISRSRDSDLGAAKLLSVMHLEYDVIDSTESLESYKCIILPDRLSLSDMDKKNLIEYTKNGGSIVASYSAIPEGLGIEKLAPSEFDNDYIECNIEGIDTPFLSYSSAYRVKAEGETFAKVYEPYFNRTHRHFCGHKNTPFKTEPADYPALIRCGQVAYFAHPVFEAYNKSGNYLLESFIIKGIELVYDRFIKVDNLPSCGKVRLRKNEKANNYVLHTLYSPPTNRGNVHLLADFPTLHDVTFTLRLDKKIKEITLEPEGEKIEFTREDDKITFTLRPFKTHKLAVLKW